MIKKVYNYDDLPKKGKLPEYQQRLTDPIILDYLNKIVENSNLLVSIEYKEEASPDKITMISVNFVMAKKS